MVPLAIEPVDEAVLFYLAHDAVVNDIVDAELAWRVGRGGLLQLDAMPLRVDSKLQITNSKCRIPNNWHLEFMIYTGAPRAAASTTPLMPGALSSKLPPRSAWILVPLDAM